MSNPRAHCGAIRQELLRSRRTGFQPPLPGHLLQEQALGEPGFPDAATHPEMAGWRAAVEASAKVRGFRVEPGLGDDARGERLGHGELFARSYAQYIARRSADPVLLAQVEKVRGSLKDGWKVWDEADFDSIAPAFDAMFTAKGWR